MTTYVCFCVLCDERFDGRMLDTLCPSCRAEIYADCPYHLPKRHSECPLCVCGARAKLEALAAAAEGGDVEQAPLVSGGGAEGNRPETSMTTLSSHKYSMKEVPND